MAIAISFKRGKQGILGERLMVGSFNYLDERNPFMRVVVRLLGHNHFGIHSRFFYFNCCLRQFNLRAKKILDFGCGSGEITMYLGKKFPNSAVVGIDIDEARIQSASSISQRAGIDNVSFLKGNEHTLPESAFDFVYSLNVLECVADDNFALRQFNHCLKGGGMLFLHLQRIGTPYNSPQFGLRKFFRHPQVNLRNKGTCFEYQCRDGYREDELTAKLLAAGFTVLWYKVTFGFWAMLAHTVFEGLRGRSRAYQYLVLPILMGLCYIDTLFSRKDGAGIAIVAQKPLKS